jgi:hypothetical protein
MFSEHRYFTTIVASLKDNRDEFRFRDARVVRFGRRFKLYEGGELLSASATMKDAVNFLMDV